MRSDVMFEKCSTRANTTDKYQILKAEHTDRYDLFTLVVDDHG
jgi:hypothetical protein